MKDVKNWSGIERRGLSKEQFFGCCCAVDDYNWGVAELELRHWTVFDCPLSVFFGR
jgi:hypothetical protein